MADDINTSGSGSATPTPPPPVTGTAPGSATPPEQASLTLEEALKKIADLEHSHGNAKEELDRHRKKLTAYEKQELERATAEQAKKDAELSEVELTKKQLAAEQERTETLAAQLHDALVFQEVARLSSKFNFVISAETLTPLLLVKHENEIEFDQGKPTNIEKLLDALAKAEPDLVRKAADTQQNAQTRSPALPPFNVSGRTSIPAPGTQPQPGKPIGWSEAFTANRQQR